MKNESATQCYKEVTAQATEKTKNKLMEKHFYLKYVLSIPISLMFVGAHLPCVIIASTEC